MATLTGSTIADSYDQLLALPVGGINGATLVALTDGKVDGSLADHTFALELSTGEVKSTGTLTAAGAATLSTSVTLATGATVTGIDDADLATGSATLLATQGAIKTYVDAQVGASDALSEILVNGNTTGSKDIIVTTGQSITTDTVSETTVDAGVTIDSVLVKDNTVAATTFTGALVGNSDTATKVYVTDNESTAEENLISFVADAAVASGNHGLEMDGNLTYNPSTGTVTSTVFSGALTGNADTVTNGVYTTNKLSVLSATTSSELAGVISDETGSGSLVFATSPTLVTPLLGTPTSGVATNLTGTAAGLTAGTVTTNANLTGEVTSAGNAATIADDVVDEANLKVDNSPTDDYVLTAKASATGGLTWASAGSGTVTSVTAGAGMTQSGTSTVNPTLDVVGTADRITANANDIDIASTYVGQTSITTLGTVGTGTWEGATVAVAQGGTGSTTASAARTALGAAADAFTQTGTGAVATTVDAKLKETVSVKDFGATGDGSTDDAAAIQLAVNAMSGGGTVYMPAGEYKILSSITLSDDNVKLVGESWGETVSGTSITIAANVIGIVVTGSYCELSGFYLSKTGTHDKSGITVGSSSISGTGVITSEFAERFRIKGVFINGMGGHGLEIIASSLAYIVDLASIFNGGDGLRIDGDTGDVVTCMNSSGTIDVRGNDGYGLYVAGDSGAVLTGAITTTASTAVVGVGTKFFNELIVGNRILVGGETRVVAAITDQTNLTVTTAFSALPEDTSPERLGYDSSAHYFGLIVAQSNKKHQIRLECKASNFPAVYTENTTTYDTGTASQTGLVVTGTLGATWAADMVGSTFTWDASPTSGVIVSVESPTSLTVSVSQSVAATANYDIAFTGLFLSAEANGNKCTVINGEITDDGDGNLIFDKDIEEGRAGVYSLLELSGLHGGWMINSGAGTYAQNLTLKHSAASEFTYTAAGHSSDCTIKHVNSVGGKVVNIETDGSITADVNVTAVGTVLGGTVSALSNYTLASHSIIDYESLGGGEYKLRLGSITGTTLNKTGIYAKGAECITIDGESSRVTILKASNSEITALTSATTITPDLDAASNFSLTLDHDTTLANPTVTLVPGQSGCIVITQGSTGGTMAYGTQWHFEGGTEPTLSTGTLVDNLVYYVASTTSIHAVLLKDLK